MLHIVLHLVAPLLIAGVFYPERWRNASLIMIATMMVDVDHFAADPVYDPERCSIGFHPLHSVFAIVIYALMFALPLVLNRKRAGIRGDAAARIFGLVGLGLLIHMALDMVDCVV